MGRGYYSNDDLEIKVQGKVYYVAVEAECDYTYEPMVMYYKDGSGYPGSEEFEVTDVSAEWHDENENVVQPTKEMETALDEYLNELDFDKWDFEEYEPEPPEYERDDY